jgi:hypothetical protein
MNYTPFEDKDLNIKKDFYFISLVNYLNWRFVNKLARYTTRQMRELFFNLDRALDGLQQQEERYQSVGSTGEI